MALLAWLPEVVRGVGGFGRGLHFAGQLVMVGSTGLAMGMAVVGAGMAGIAGLQDGLGGDSGGAWKPGSPAESGRLVLLEISFLSSRNHSPPRPILSTSCHSEASREFSPPGYPRGPSGASLGSRDPGVVHGSSIEHPESHRVPGGARGQGRAKGRTGQWEPGQWFSAPQKREGLGGHSLHYPQEGSRKAIQEPVRVGGLR